jgi:predicted nucleic acid-binding protein
VKPLLDLNVLLDYFRGRSPWDADAAAILRANQAGQLTAHVAAFSLPTLYYVIRKAAGRPVALQAVRACLDDLTVIRVDAAVLELAYAQSGIDFEDNLQLACALAAQLDAIVTRDPAGFVGSPIPILSPADLVARLPPAPPGP